MHTTAYRDRHVLITGGTGFIGSNLAQALVSEKAHVTLLSRSDTHLKFIQDILANAQREGVELNIIIGDLRDEELMKQVVQGKDYVFNFAAQVSHLDKGVVSLEDLDINVRGQLTLLEALRCHNREAKVIFSSTRMVYGDDAQNPIHEDSPTNPTTLYGIHKLAAEKYHLSYFHRYGIRTVILRVGNPYGDRQHFSKGLYSLPGYFMRRAMNDETIEICSDGKQYRDYLYIGDLVEILMRAGATPITDGKIYNTGSGVRSTFGEMVQTIAKVVKTGRFVAAENVQASSGDSYYLDITRLSNDIGWRPVTSLKEGMVRMHTFAEKYPCK